MTALAQDRKFVSIKRVWREKRPLKAGVKTYKDALAACKAGFYQPATATIGARIVGRFLESVDNTAGADGAQFAEVEFFQERVCVGFVNKTGDLLTAADRETLAYVEDDQTVRKTSAGTSAAGLVYEIEGTTVFVEVGVFA